MKKTLYFFITIISCSLIQNSGINAQVLSPLSPGNQAIYINFGLDYAFVPTFGYARGFHNSTFNRDIMLLTEISSPLKIDFHDYRYKFGGQAILLNFSSLDFSGAFSFIVRGTKNSIHNATSFGMDVTFMLGHYRKHWFVAGEFGFDKAIFTHIHHSDWYKTYFYSDAKDSWYRNTAGNVHYGFRVGLALTRIEFTLRVGVQKSKSLIDPLIPFFGVVGINYRF